MTVDHRVKSPVTVRKNNNIFFKFQGPLQAGTLKLKQTMQEQNNTTNDQATDKVLQPQQGKINKKKIEAKPSRVFRYKGPTRKGHLGA